MNIQSESVKSSLTFKVCTWKTDLRTYNLKLHFPAPELLRELNTLQSKSSSGDSQSDFHTPSVLLVSKHPSSIHPHSNRPRSTPDASISGPDHNKRSIVLDVLRRHKMTRRELAQEAGVSDEDFRAMNYWLRGKEITNEVVLKAGARVYEWAVETNKRTRIQFEESIRRIGPDEESSDSRSERTFDETPMMKRIRHLPSRITANFMAGVNADLNMGREHEPFTLKTPQSRVATSITATPLPATWSTPGTLGKTGTQPKFSRTPHPQQIPGPVTYSPEPYPITTTPLQGFYSPLKPAPVSLVEPGAHTGVQRSSSAENSTVAGVSGPTPAPSPFASPGTMELLRREDMMLEATPGVGATPQKKGQPASISRRLFDGGNQN